MKNDRFDKTIMNALQENGENIDIFKDLLIVPKDEMMLRIKNSGKKNEKKTSNYRVKLMKVMILVLTFFTMSIVSSIILESGKASAFSLSFKKFFIDMKDGFINIVYTGREEKEKSDNELKVYTSSNIAEIQKSTVLDIYVPQSLPNEYSLKEIKHEKLFNDKENIIQTYENETGGKFLIIQKKGLTDIDLVVEVPNNCEVKETIIMGQLGHIILYENGYETALWFKDGIQYEISGKFNEGELLKILGTNK